MPAAGNRSRSTKVDGSARLAGELARLQGELVELPPLVRTSTCGDAVAATLSAGVRRLLTHLGELSTSDDIETLHQARVALRRLRTDLRTFRSLIDPEVAAGLAPDLAWLTNSIGRVRDHDVFVEILAGYERRTPEVLGISHLVERYRVLRPGLLGRFTDELLTERALATLATVTTLAADPPLVALVDEPAAEVLTELARAPWRKLVRDAGAVTRDDAVEQLHELRLRVKKARYAVEAAALVRPEAERHARALAGLQATLGDISDASLTIHRLQEDVEQDLSGAAAFAAGVVAATEQRRIEDRRGQWPARWDRARRKRVAGWLQSNG